LYVCVVLPFDLQTFDRDPGDGALYESRVTVPVGQKRRRPSNPSELKATQLRLKRDDDARACTVGFAINCDAHCASGELLRD
jgi:hypothetical protein